MRNYRILIIVLPTIVVEFLTVWKCHFGRWRILEKQAQIFFSHWLSSFIIRENFRKLWWTVFEALLAKLKQVPQKWQFMRTYRYANFNFLQKNVRENFIRNCLFWFNLFCANVGHFKPRQFFGARLSVNFEIDCQ